jgi:hypothetical protein
MSGSIIGDVLSQDVQPTKFDNNSPGSSSAALASINNNRLPPSFEGDVDVKMIIHASKVPEELWAGLNELVDHSPRNDIEIVTDREQAEHIQTDGEFDWLIRCVFEATTPFPPPSPPWLSALFLFPPVSFSLFFSQEDGFNVYCDERKGQGRREEREREGVSRFTKLTRRMLVQLRSRTHAPRWPARNVGFSRQLPRTRRRRAV